jgi:hypothetical protein
MFSVFENSENLKIPEIWSYKKLILFYKSEKSYVSNNFQKYSKIRNIKVYMFRTFKTS